MSKITLSPDETAYICEQTALMLNAGMQLSDGFEMLSDDIDDKRIKAVCTLLIDALNEGLPLCQAMEKSGAFPAYAVNMVRIGSITGRLEDVLRGLTEYYEDRAEMTRTIRSAVLHPLLLLVMMTVVIIVLVVLVIPMFGDIFSRFDSAVNETVSSTVGFAYHMGTVILIVMLCVIVIIIAAALTAKIPAAKNKLAEFFSAFPLTKGLSRRFTMAKVTKAISVMVASGIAPDETLENAAGLISDKKIKDKLLKCREKVLDGASFADAVSEAGMLPALHARSLKIAYNSGSFEEAWSKISSRSNEEAAQTAAGLIAFIEPAIVIVLAALIGGILLTIMIPLMNIMSVLG